MDLIMPLPVSNISKALKSDRVGIKIKTVANIIFMILGLSITIFLYANETKDLVEPPSRTDFYKFYLSSQYLLKNNPIYWSAPDRSSQTAHCNTDSQIAEKNMPSWEAMKQMPHEVLWCMHPNLNPPFFVVLTTTFAVLDYPVAWWAWTLLSILCGVSSLIIIFKSEILRSNVSFLQRSWLGIAFFAYYPTFASISYGQVTLLLFLPITLAWLALRNEKYYIAGAWLGLASSIKPLLGLFLISLLLSRNFRAVVGYTIVFTICFIIGGVIVGFSAYFDYLKVLSEVNWLATSWNGSFYGFFYRIFGGSLNSPWLDMPILAKVLSQTGSVLVFLSLIYTIFQASNASRFFKADILMALTIPAMLLMSPLGWMYYFPLLIISYIVNYKLSENFKNERILKLMMLFFITPTFLPNGLLPLTAVNTVKVWLWSAGMYFYVLVFVFSMSIILVRKMSITYENL